MGSLRLTLCTGILAAAALTPAAHAADGAHDGGVTVTPANPAPGTDVSLRADGCSGSQGTATSSAFVSDARLTGDQGALGGETRVISTLTPGAYDVRVTCADRVLTGRFTVAGDSRDSSDPEDPLAPASPVAPVHAGGGGTATRADTTRFATVATTGSGPGTLQAVTGLALAGCAAAAVGVLRARRSRGRD